MKQLITKSLVMLVLFAAALNLAGCASVFLSTFKMQRVTIVADDDDTYDFYVNGNLECKNTNECDFYRSTYSRCKMTIEAARDNVIPNANWEASPFSSSPAQ